MQQLPSTRADSAGASVQIVDLSIFNAEADVEGLVFQALAFIYQVADVFAFLVITAAGLAIIFGMMGIINMAHGEFITCGAYMTTLCVRGGAPLPLAIGIGALCAGLLGVVLERLIVRWFYNRPIDSLVATWGISLILTQGALLLLGSAWSSVGTPLGSVALGNYSFAVYRIVMVAVAIALLLGLYLLFTFTTFGVHARATMQNASMARALGVPVERIYCQTFGLGAALAGLAGGLYAPTLTLSPTMGTGFVVEAFVTVVVGGANVLSGTAPASVVLAAIRAAITAGYGQVYGLIGLLVTVCIVIRVLPEGFSGWLARRRA